MGRPPLEDAGDARLVVMEVQVQASRLEPVAGVIVPQLSVAHQSDRGDTWTKRRSRGSPSSQLGLLLALQMDFGGHVRIFKSPRQRCWQV
ncbi:hypothetical protein EYF80_009238 [Liparis tanakae]|uniref:Uncharacterized protein n=1 Tax=Liparis tanakae TaxID=230148 RepID=A0A4Z2IR85_9TELE|nr:hypothetical protein EYF80_009238 [Liparis tanakae]